MKADTPKIWSFQKLWLNRDFGMQHVHLVPLSMTLTLLAILGQAGSPFDHCNHDSLDSACLFLHCCCEAATRRTISPGLPSRFFVFVLVTPGKDAARACKGCLEPRGRSTYFQMHECFAGHSQGNRDCRY